MLIHAGKMGAQVIEGPAQIVIVVDGRGMLRLYSYFKGRQDSSYAALGDSRLQIELQKLVDELREQIQSDPTGGEA